MASIEYRTASNGATYKDAISDVKSAIRYLRAHCDRHGINPSKVAVWGQSAGGYLAAMTGVTNALEQFEGDGNLGQSSVVQAVVDEFGPSDLSKVASDYDQATQKAKYLPGNSLAQFVFGAGTELSIQDDPTASAGRQPTHLCRLRQPTVRPPPRERRRATVAQPNPDPARRVARQGSGEHRYVVNGANHGELPFLGGDTTLLKQWSSQQVMGVIVRFLQKHLR